MPRLGLVVSIAASVILACTPQPTPDVDATVGAAVAATRSSMPIATPIAAPTDTPYPTFTPYPTHTPLPTFTAAPTLTPEPSPTPTTNPTPEPTSTPAPATAAASAGVVPQASVSGSGVMLLETIRTQRGWINDYGWLLLRAYRDGEPIDCHELVRMYDTIAADPMPSVPTNDPVLLWAQDRLREAIGIFVDGARDLTGHCRERIAGNSAQAQANTLEFTMAKAGVRDADHVFHAAISRLEEEGY